MATIDDKVVAMSFESSKFESGVSNTISALDKLKAALHLPNAGKELEGVGAAAKRIDLSHIGRGIDAINQKLSYFSVAALAIFANVAAGAVRAGANFAKAFSVDPLIAGFKEYSTNLNSIQTILSNTASQGTNLKDVNAALAELNRYSDKTIYNFSEMARNIGTFTAAGVDLKTSTASIKGIANLAALSGSNANQASTAMYQLSQAIASGTVRLQDWMSVEHAGMGGAVFQKALVQTAVAAGTLNENLVKLKGPMKTITVDGQSFRNSLSRPGKDNWLTTDVLTKTLKQFTGDLSDAKLAADGFNASQIKAIQSQAKVAQDAATKVKTISQVFDVAKETAGSGWAQTFQIIFGDFEEAKTTFTALSNAINGFINKNAEARNKVLGDWKALGGRVVLIQSIKQTFEALGEILKPIKEAFRDIFPATTGKNLFDLTMRFEEFSRALKPSKETIENLRRTFRGLFAIFGLGATIIGEIFGVFARLFGVVGTGQGGFLSFTATVGDLIYRFVSFLEAGDKIHKFFLGLSSVIAAPVKILKMFAGLLGDLFSGFSSGGVTDKLDGMGKAMTPLQAIVEGLSDAWDKLVDSFKGSVDMTRILEGIGTAISGIGVAIGNAAANMNFEAIFAAIRTGLFAGLVLMFKQFLGRGSFLQQITKGFGSGILSNISGIFNGLNGSMQAMQQNIKAKTLKEIAIAIALLAASLFVISLIDPEKLNSSLGAMTVMFGELIGAMALLNKISATGGFLKLPIIIAGLIGLAIAIDLLTVAVLAMSRLSWDELLKGLGGVAVLLATVSKAVVPLSANSGGLIRASFAIGVLAVALNLLALAVKQLGSMGLVDLGKGLVGVSVGLRIMTGALERMPLVKAVGMAGLITMAIALNILARAVKQFASMSLSELGKGLGGMAIGLTAMVVALQKMPEKMDRQAASLLLLAIAMQVLSGAIAKMGGMSIEQIAKGLGTLAGALLILGVAMKNMEGNVRGAAALSLTASALALLAPALVLMGKQSLGNIVKSLISLGGALLIMGVAGTALTSAVPALLGLGAALFLMGGGLALAGAGLLAIAAGISALAIAGPAGIGIMVAALKEFFNLIPEFAKNLVLGLLEIAKGLAETAPEFVNAIVTIINSLLDAIIKSTPKIAQAFIVLLDAALGILRDRQDEIIQAGYALLIALLDGIKNNIAQVATSVTTIIVTFLGTLAKNIGRIVTAGVELLLSLLRGIANNIGKVVTAGLDIVAKFIQAVVGGYGRILTAGIGILVKLIAGIGQNLRDLIAAGTNAIVQFIKGIESAGERIIRAGVAAAGKFINALAKQIVNLADQVFTALITLINGMADTIDARAPELRQAGVRLGMAIINGLTGGITAKAGELYGKISSVMDHAMSLVKKIPLIGSPSKVTTKIGEFIVQGLVVGIDNYAPKAYASATAMSNGVIDAFNNTFQTASPSKVMIEIGQYVGQGFAQGLRGSKDDIVGAFAELNEKLTDAMTTARETIASEEEKLAKLRAEKKPDTDAIKKAQEIINQNEALLARSTAARKILISSLKDEKTELIGLTQEYENVGNKLKAAQDKLAQLKQDRQSTLTGFQDQFSALPGLEMTDSEGNPIDPSEQLARYLDALRNQSAAVATYKTTLDQLRKLGLDDATYEKLLKEGTADQSFANQLLAGGKTAVQSLNKLDTQLMKVSGELATNAANNLKNAGIEAAEGLIKGLQSKHNAIRHEMEEIAREMLRALRKELNSKSPSKEFEEIGIDSMLGLANGFSKSTQIVTSAVTGAGRDAISAMKASMNSIAGMVSSDINPNLVITPVFDLTTIRAQSGELAALTAPITATASFGQASIISSEQNAATQVEDTSTASGGPIVKYEQNNYSPVALSEIEIYRQTRNQLSQIKTALAVT